MIGSILLFLIPTQHNHKHQDYYFVIEGLAIIAAVILISFIIWLIMMASKKLMAFVAAMTLSNIKTEFLTVFAWSSCVISLAQYLLK